MGILFVRLRWIAIPAVLVATAVAVSPAGASGAHGVVTSAPGLARSVVAELNRVRQEHGLRPLQPSPGLAAAARAHSREMVSSGRFEHESPDGTAFWKRIGRFYGAAGFRTWQVGENLIWSPGTLTAAAVVKGWLDSPPHRRIMLDPAYREIGVAAVRDTRAPADFRDSDATIVTADFGARVRS